MDTIDAKRLLERFREGTCSNDEKQLVLQWYKQLVDTGEWQWGEEERHVLQQTMEYNLLEQINTAGIKKLYQFPFRKWAVAASILLVVGLGSYFMFFNKDENHEEIAGTTQPVDIKPPQTNRAMITLANGKQVYLDSAVDGMLLQQAGVEVVKLADGKIIYKGSTDKVLYNTLSNPKGSKVMDMTLADGSRVWLNAGSSVTYPVAFIGTERKVSITGEAYFEVAHNSVMPFIVSKGETKVTVLGTHFNVNAYDDESSIKITLLEGSVKVNNTMIKPGEQANVSADVKVIQDVDLDEVMAWKNGRFYFANSDLKTIMRQVMRWYDIDVLYQGNVPERFFTADISRSTNLSEFLRVLEVSKIRFRIEEKRLVVLQ